MIKNQSRYIITPPIAWAIYFWLFALSYWTFCCTSKSFWPPWFSIPCYSSHGLMSGSLFCSSGSVFCSSGSGFVLQVLCFVPPVYYYYSCGTVFVLFCVSFSSKLLIVVVLSAHFSWLVCLFVVDSLPVQTS